MEWSFEKPGPDFEAKALTLSRDGASLPIVVTGTSEKRLTNALIDTGASFSAIKPRLAGKIGLKVTDRRRISGVSPTGSLAEGDADVVFAFLGLQQPDVDLPAELIVADFSRGDANLSILLGRPFLQNFDLFYEGKCGRFKLIWANSQQIGLDD